MVSLWVTKSRLNHTDPPETHKINTHLFLMGPLMIWFIS